MRFRDPLIHRLTPTSHLGRLLRLANLRRKPLRRQDVVHRETLRSGPLTFIQIGANDGVVADPLHPFVTTFGWSGTMVEPQPFVFAEKLEPLYRDNPRINLVNAAVGPESGAMPLFVFSFSNERWATGKASLDRNVVQRGIDPGMIQDLASRHGVELPQDVDEWITSIDVPVMTAEQLLGSANTTDFDLLHVDTEGADGMIVRQFDFTKLSTRIVQFEHIHLSDIDLASTCVHLSNAGFEIHVDGMDVLATRSIKIGRSSMRKLADPWQR